MKNNKFKHQNDLRNYHQTLHMDIIKSGIISEESIITSVVNTKKSVFGETNSIHVLKLNALRHIAVNYLEDENIYFMLELMFETGIDLKTLIDLNVDDFSLNENHLELTNSKIKISNYNSILSSNFSVAFAEYLDLQIKKAYNLDDSIPLFIKHNKRYTMAELTSGFREIFKIYQNNFGEHMTISYMKKLFIKSKKKTFLKSDKKFKIALKKDFFGGKIYGTEK